MKVKQTIKSNRVQDKFVFQKANDFKLQKSVRRNIFVSRYITRLAFQFIRRAILTQSHNLDIYSHLSLSLLHNVLDDNSLEHHFTLRSDLSFKKSVVFF